MSEIYQIKVNKLEVYKQDEREPYCAHIQQGAVVDAQITITPTIMSNYIAIETGYETLTIALNDSRIQEVITALQECQVLREKLKQGGFECRWPTQ